MIQRQAIVYGQTGQEVEIFPPEYTRGVPSTATYAVYEAIESNDNSSELSGSATIDSVSTTVDVASGYSQMNRRRLYVASTTNIVKGRPYVLANASLERERVTPSAIASGDYIDLDADLAYDYPVTTSTLKGLRTYFTVDSTWVADESNINSYTEPYRVLWTYTIDSVVYRSWSYFDLVRQRKLSSVNVDDLVEVWPDLQLEEWAAQRGQGFAKQIDAAMDRIEFDARFHGVDVNQIRDTSLFGELHRSAVVMILARAGLTPGGRDRESFVAEARKQYADDFMQAIGVLKIPVDQGKEGGITDRPVRQFVFSR